MNHDPLSEPVKGEVSIKKLPQAQLKDIISHEDIEYINFKEDNKYDDELRGTSFSPHPKKTSYYLIPRYVLGKLNMFRKTYKVGPNGGKKTKKIKNRKSKTQKNKSRY